MSNISAAKANLASLDARMNSAIQAKLDKFGPQHATKYDSMGAATVGAGCVVEVASDTNAMTEALAEYGFRLFMEDDSTWEVALNRTWFNAKRRTMAKLADELKSKMGQK